MMDGVALIAAERKRQVEEEGYSATHDARHDDFSLSLAAQCYIMETIQPGDGDALWPWASGDWKPGADIDNLVRAGALIAAEIDRVLKIVREAPE